jgi:hypothetical protein
MGASRRCNIRHGGVVEVGPLILNANAAIGNVAPVRSGRNDSRRVACHSGPRSFHDRNQSILARLSLSALPITDTEEKLIAAAATIGLRRIPKNGKSTPAARGTPAAL